MGVARRRGGGGLDPGRRCGALPAHGPQRPAFLAYHNFDVYLGWNESLVYSTTAAYYATRSRRAPRVGQGNGSVDVLDAAQIKAIQQALAARGQDPGPIDGKMGSRTREAVRAVQIQLGLPADGWPDHALLGDSDAGRRQSPCADARFRLRWSQPSPRAGSAAMFDLLVRNANLPDGRTGIDIAIAGGTIVAVGPAIAGEAATTIDATGRLVSPPFIDPHFHMDATLSLGLPRLNRSGTLLEGIALWGELKPLLTVEAVMERALRYCDLAVSQGLLAIRTHVDVCDDRLTAVDALVEVRRL